MTTKVTAITTPRGERITTNRTITTDLRASLIQRRGVTGSYAGRTLGEFLTACLALPGITLDSEIAAIDYGTGQWGSGVIFAEIEPNGDLTIRELSAGDGNAS